MAVPQRFTLDGGPALEAHLAATGQRVLAAVESLIPKDRLLGILLAGGYGRGEGGVLRDTSGEHPYNDLEYYVFVRGNTFLQERRYREALHHLGESLSPEAGIEVEFKVITPGKLRKGPVTMFSYDLVSAHRWVLGTDRILEGCTAHLNAADIPLHEVTRLLMNRCSGLLFCVDRFKKREFTPEDADFVGRNLAKARLALGDAWLAAQGLYHWSARKRHETLRPNAWPNCPVPIEALRSNHAVGVEFKLHPVRTQASKADLMQQHAALVELARPLWFWVESRRLRHSFNAPEDYLEQSIDKCPETRAWRNVVVNLLARGPSRIISGCPLRYPRQRLLHALTALLFVQGAADDPKWSAYISRELDSDADNWDSWMGGYRRLWNRFN